MKRLLIAVLVISLGWFAYWFIGSNGARTAYENWFEQQRAAGWQADYQDLQMRGFPNRFDATFEKLALADPQSGLAWTAPFFQIFALSYRPNHIIAVWPEQHVISTPNQTIEINSSKMQASVVFAPNTRLTLQRANFATDNASLGSNADWTTAADSFRAALSQSEDEETTYQIALQGIGIAPPKALRNDVLPEKMSALDLEATVGFDHPWDLTALEKRRPQPRSLTIKTAKAEWGPMRFQAAGDMTIDDRGTPTGELTIRAEEWQKFLDVARATGQFAPIALDSAQQGLTLLSRASGSPENIDVTLTFKAGFTFIGPLPIGPAPVFVLR